MVHANGPLVVLHHKDAGQLVQGGHVHALVELACKQLKGTQPPQKKFWRPCSETRRTGLQAMERRSAVAERVL